MCHGIGDREKNQQVRSYLFCVKDNLAGDSGIFRVPVSYTSPHPM